MLLKSESCRQVFHSQEPIQAAICRGRGPLRPPSITCDRPGRGDEAGPFRPLHCNGLEFADYSPAKLQRGTKHDFLIMG